MATENEDKIISEYLESYDIKNCGNFIKKATVVGIGNDFCIVDFGEKAMAEIPFSELKDTKVSLGSEFEISVDKLEDKNGIVVVSIDNVAKKKTFEKIKQSLINSTQISCLVKTKTHGGLIVDIDGVSAFLPGSLVSTDENCQLEEYVNKELNVIVVKISRSNNIIVSHRAIIENNLKIEKQEIIKTLEKGQIIEGTVCNITSYGAFVNIKGNINGLLHITDISWNKVNNPNDVLKINQKVKVVILGIEDDNISLGMKQLEQSPWDKLKEGDLEVGAIVDGKVSGIVDFGMFVNIAEGIDGLVRKTEFLWNNKRSYFNIKKHYKIGDDVKVKILEIDYEEQKVFLSVKKVNENPFLNEKIIEGMYVGSKHSGRIIDTKKTYAIVKLDNDIDGFLYSCNISWIEKVKDVSKYFKINEKVEVKVLSFDKEKCSASFGLKQMSQNPLEEYEDEFKIGSEHEGTVVKKTKASFIIKLEHDLNAFCSKNNVNKDSVFERNSKHIFKIIDYNKNNLSIEVVPKDFKYDFNKNKKVKKIKESTIADLISKI